MIDSHDFPFFCFHLWSWLIEQIKPYMPQRYHSQSDSQTAAVQKRGTKCSPLRQVSLVTTVQRDPSFFLLSFTPISLSPSDFLPLLTLTISVLSFLFPFVHPPPFCPFLFRLSCFALTSTVLGFFSPPS